MTIRGHVFEHLGLRIGYRILQSKGGLNRLNLHCLHDLGSFIERLTFALATSCLRDNYNNIITLSGLYNYCRLCLRSETI